MGLLTCSPPPLYSAYLVLAVLRFVPDLPAAAPATSDSTPSRLPVARTAPHSLSVPARPHHVVQPPHKRFFFARSCVYFVLTVLGCAPCFPAAVPATNDSTPSRLPVARTAPHSLSVPARPYHVVQPPRKRFFFARICLLCLRCAWV